MFYFNIVYLCSIALNRSRFETSNRIDIRFIILLFVRRPLYTKRYHKNYRDGRYSKFFLHLIFYFSN